MGLKSVDMKRLAKLGVTAEAMAFIAEIFERNGDATQPATPDATGDATPAKTDKPAGSPSKSTERSRKWREKKKLGAVSTSVAVAVASVAGGVALPVLVSPTPSSLLSESSLIQEVMKDEEEVEITRETKNPKGCRIPDDFVPDASCEKLARELHYTKSQWNTALAEFFDFWRGEPGRRGFKLDWQATFRNKLRNAARNRKGNANATHTIRGSLEQAFDFIDRRDQREQASREESSNDAVRLLPGLRQSSA